MPVPRTAAIRLSMAACGLTLLLPSILLAAARSAENPVTAVKPLSSNETRVASVPVAARADSSPATPSPTAATASTSVAPRTTADLGATPGTAFRIKAPDLKELSGLAASDATDAFYAVQDAGNASVLYVLDGAGQPLGEIRVPFENIDWEDVALTRNPGRRGYLFIADTGDASVTRKAQKLAARTTFNIIRIDEPSVGQPQTLRTAGQPVRYPVRFEGDKAHNVESILVAPDGGQVFLIDKSADAGTPAGVWAGPPVMSTEGNVFHQIATLSIPGISSGSFSPGGRFIALRDADRVYFWPTGTAGVAAALAGTPTVMDLPKQPQGESLTFTADGSVLLVGSEGAENPVLSVPLPSFLVDPVYPFTTATLNNPAPKYLAAFGGSSAIVIGAVCLIRRRRLGSDF
jgi:hypothetical protein